MVLGLKGNLHSVLISNSKQRVIFTTFKMASSSLKALASTYSGIETLWLGGGFDPIINYVVNGTTEHLPISPISSVKDAFDPESKKKIYFYMRRPIKALASAVGTVIEMEGDRIFRRIENDVLKKEVLKYPKTSKFGFLESLPNELMIDFIREALHYVPEYFYSDAHATNFYYPRLLATLNAIAVHNPELLKKVTIVDLDHYEKSDANLRLMSTEKLMHNPLSKKNVNTFGSITLEIERLLTVEPMINLDVFKVLTFNNNLCYQDIKTIYADYLLV